MKDFANSADQLIWKHSATRHAKMKAFLAEPGHSQVFIDHCQREVARLEEEFPQLKQPIVKETS